MEPFSERALRIGVNYTVGNSRCPVYRSPLVKGLYVLASDIVPRNSIQTIQALTRTNCVEPFH